MPTCRCCSGPGGQAAQRAADSRSPQRNWPSAGSSSSTSHTQPATRQRLQTYEFLHATFGEFLVARLVTQILTDMVARETAAASSPLGGVDDGLLHALLSFAALTAAPLSWPSWVTCWAGWTPAQRQVLADLLLRLHSRALYPRTESPTTATSRLR